MNMTEVVLYLNAGRWRRILDLEHAIDLEKTNITEDSMKDGKPVTQVVLNQREKFKEARISQYDPPISY